jgi:uncharacterized protein (TIGR03000 family)
MHAGVAPAGFARAGVAHFGGVGFNRGSFGGFTGFGGVGFNRGSFGGFTGFGGFNRGLGYSIVPFGRGYGLGLGRGFGVGLGLGYGGYGYPYGYYSDYYGYPYGIGYSSLYNDPAMGGGYADSAPATQQAPQKPPDDNLAHLLVVVPENAELWFNDTKTSQTGAQREFVSPALTPGKSYTYEIKARWTEDGKPVEQTRSVHVQANAWQVIDFTKPQMPAAPKD